MRIGPVEDHREREGGVLVYPVYSRRSGGLSVGINLFPDRKICPFDCPYCEVFPFQTDFRFSLSLMEEALKLTLARSRKQGIEVRDICFSGSGEPTLSPAFPAALESAARIRDAEVPAASLVTITNGAGLLEEEIFSLLGEAARGKMGLDLWLKLDAGTEAWYREIDRSAIPFERLIAKIKAFAELAPFTLQNMLCRVKGRPPPPEEGAAWEALALGLASAGGNQGGIRAVQIYGKARPAPLDPLAEPLEDIFLETRAASLRKALAGLGKNIPVEVYT
jgi:histidinol dehydrogenase